MSDRRILGWTAAVFAANGAAFGSLAPRLPEFVDRLDLTPEELGFVLFVGMAGSLIGSIGAAAATTRFGPRLAVSVSSVVLAVSLVGVGTWLSVPLVTLAMAVAGAGDGLMDVAMNVATIDVERRRRRSTLHAMHAAWSAGLLASAGIATAAAALGVPFPLHFAFMSTIVAAIGVLGPRVWDAGGRIPDGMGLRLRSLPRPLLAIGVAAMVGGVLEIVPFDWGALYLTERFDAGPGLAGSVVVVGMAAMMAGRLIGDRMVDRLGAGRALASFSAVAAAGVLVAIAAPNPSAVLGGVFVFGVGAAFAFPSLVSMAGSVQGISTDAGVAAMSTMARVGFVVAPLVAGFVAERQTVRTALWLSVGAGAILAAWAIRQAESRVPSRESRV